MLIVVRHTATTAHALQNNYLDLNVGDRVNSIDYGRGSQLSWTDYRPILAASNAKNSMGRNLKPAHCCKRARRTRHLGLKHCPPKWCRFWWPYVFQAQIEQARRKKERYYDAGAQLYTEVVSYRVNNFIRPEPVYNKAIWRTRNSSRSGDGSSLNPWTAGGSLQLNLLFLVGLCVEAKFPDPCFIEGNYVERYRVL